MLDDVRELVNGCLAGDEVAMVELVERYRGQVFGLCYRMLGDREEAEDVTQESFLRVFRSLATWDNTRDFRPWVLAIAGNRCRSTLAQRTRRPATSQLLDDPPDSALGSRATRGLFEEVELAMQSLRDEYRQAFVLFHGEQLSYAEIGEVLACPVGTVKTWIHRARRELAQALRQRGIVQESGHEV